MTNTLKQLAFEYLNSHGYKILLRDYGCTLGEIDFVAKTAGYLVFIAVNREPEAMRKVANYYIKRYGIRDVKIRFDRIDVELKTVCYLQKGE